MATPGQGGSVNQNGMRYYDGRCDIPSFDEHDDGDIVCSLESTGAICHVLSFCWVCLCLCMASAGSGYGGDSGPHDQPSRRQPYGGDSSGGGGSYYGNMQDYQSQPQGQGPSYGPGSQHREGGQADGRYEGEDEPSQYGVVNDLQEEFR